MSDHPISGMFWTHPRIAGEARSAGKEARRAAAEAGHAARGVEELERSLDRLALITQGMWNLLHTRLGITEQELIDEVRRLDLLDGHEDGRLQRGPKECAACKRRNNARHDHCLYCGGALPDETAFDRL